MAAGSMKASRLLLAAFMASLLVEGIARPQVIHGDILFRDQPVLDETERLKLFYERHGAYPDPKWLEHENPNYSRVMEERTKEVMKIKDREKRFHEWQFLCQARMVPTFTENQWGIEFVPKEMHDKLYKKFHEMLPSAGDEGLGLAVNGRESGAKFFPQEDLNYEVLYALKPMFEKWSGVDLEPTSVYGVRVYQDGQTLDDHLDILETHVISGILHIDSDLDEPFPIQILESSTGELASVNLKPGQVMYYESAKSYHQRSIPMKGRYYASIFMHYRPKYNWNITRHDTRIAIPPWWDEGADAPSETPGPPPVIVTFVNNGQVPVTLNWVVPGSKATSPDGKEQMKGLVTIPAGQSVEQRTFAGHEFWMIGDGYEVQHRVASHHHNSFLSLIPHEDL